MPKRPRKQIPPSQRWHPPPDLIPLFPESIPQEISHAIWEQFFRATRDMVARCRPDLFHLWDFHAREFRWALQALDTFEQHRKSGTPLSAYPLGQIRGAYEWLRAGFGFPMLLRILKDPKSVEAAAHALEADKLPIVGSADIAMADQVKETIRLYRESRLRYGVRLTLDRLNELEEAIKQTSARHGWPVYGPEYYEEDGFPRDDLKLDAEYFEQIAARRVLPELLRLTPHAGTFRPSTPIRTDTPDFHRAMLKLVGFPIPVPRGVLEECCPNWRNPAQYAHDLLALYFKKEAATVAKALSQARTARQRATVQTADLRTFDPRTIDLRPLILP